MFGLGELALSFLRRQVGLRSDEPSAGGSLHGKVAGLYRHPMGLSLMGPGTDGDYNPGSNQTLSKTLYLWRDVNIAAGRTITAPTPGIVICARDVVISGLLTATGKGAPGGSNTGGAGSNGDRWYGGGGGGGGGYEPQSLSGGNGGDGAGTGGLGDITAGNPGNADPLLLLAMRDRLSTAATLGGGGGGGGARSDGGAGGAGGGIIVISCRSLTINSGGAIRAEGLRGSNGTNYGGGGGGGGGGAIYIITRAYTNNGTVSVAGGSGGSGGPQSGTYPGGSGGSGKVVVEVI